MTSVQPTSKLQELELAHAGEEELKDLKYSAALTTDLAEVREGYFMSVSLIGAICGIALTTLASYFGFSPAAAVISVIDADIGPSANPSLFSIIWQIANAIGIIVFGRTSDKFGRRWFLIGASGLGFIGGIISCTAQTMNTLVGGNVLQGLAAGVHTCYGLTVGEICPNKYKFPAVAAVVVPNIIATGFGAFLGITLTHTASWRYIYYIYLAIMGFATILLVLFYHPPSFRQLHGNERTRMEEVKRIDWVGMFLLVASLILFLLGVSWGGQLAPWSSPRILGLLISGGLLLLIFGLWEQFSHTPNPLVPLHFFRDVRGFTILFIIASISGVGYTATAIIWPSQIAAIYASTITSWQRKAWVSTTIAFGIYSGIILWGPLIPIIKHVRIQLIIMMAMFVAFMGALVTCNPSNFGQSAAFSFLATFPSGILEVAAGLLVQLDCNDADLGTAFAIIFLGKSAIGTIFTAVFVAILDNKVPAELVKHVALPAVSAGLPSSSVESLLVAIGSGVPGALAKVPGITTKIEGVVGAAIPVAYAAAYAYVYYAAMAVALVGLIATVCIKDYDPYFTNHVSRQIYKGGKEYAGAVKEGHEKDLSHSSLEHGLPTEVTVHKEKAGN